MTIDLLAAFRPARARPKSKVSQYRTAASAKKFQTYLRDSASLLAPMELLVCQFDKYSSLLGLNFFQAGMNSAGSSDKIASERASEYLQVRARKGERLDCSCAGTGRELN